MEGAVQSDWARPPTLASASCMPDEANISRKRGKAASSALAGRLVRAGKYKGGRVAVNLDRYADRPQTGRSRDIWAVCATAARQHHHALGQLLAEFGLPDGVETLARPSGT